MPTAPGVMIELPGRGISLCVRDWGGPGPAIVLLHGLSSNSRIWDMVAPVLNQDFRVVAVDLRGHGLSDRTDDGYGFGDVTADLVSLLATLDIARPFVAGHSWGASVALHFAASTPGAARAIALVDGGFMELSRWSSWEDAERMMQPPEIDGTPVDRFIGFMRKWPQFRDNWSDDLAEIVLANFDVRDGKIYRRLPIPNHMKIARAIYDSESIPVLARLDCPALAISCHREPASEAERGWQQHRQESLERLRHAAPSVQLHVMEDTIHDVPIQRPVELGRVVRSFFSRVP